jgi:hypothetical protein
MLLRGALNADGLVGLKMNVAETQLEAVVAQLPALKRPTVSSLYDSGWVAVEIVVEGEAGARPDPAAQARRSRGDRRVRVAEGRLLMLPTHPEGNADAAAAGAGPKPLIEVSGLTKHFAQQGGMWSRGRGVVRAVGRHQLRDPRG